MIETAVTTTTNRARPPRLYRGLVPRLDTPRPMGPELPALFQDDSFAQRLTGAFDDMLAPVFSTLDNFEAYLDAWLSPEDFLDWLGAWVVVNALYSATTCCWIWVPAPRAPTPM